MTVHPRGRGERVKRLFRRYDGAGSSPRARGTPYESPVKSGPGRFIPAGAGNAVVAPGRHPLISVHPRGRGERAVVYPGSGCNDGSSPRARGTRRDLE